MSPVTGCAVEAATVVTWRLWLSRTTERLPPMASLDGRCGTDELQRDSYGALGCVHGPERMGTWSVIDGPGPVTIDPAGLRSTIVLTAVVWLAAGATPGFLAGRRSRPLAAV